MFIAQSFSCTKPNLKDPVCRHHTSWQLSDKENILTSDLYMFDLCSSFCHPSYHLILALIIKDHKPDEV